MYHEWRFFERVKFLRDGQVLFEAAGVQYVKRGCDLWVIGDNCTEARVIYSVADYVESLNDVAENISEWMDDHGDDEQLQADVERIREEIAEYEEA